MVKLTGINWCVSTLQQKNPKKENKKRSNKTQHGIATHARLPVSFPLREIHDPTKYPDVLTPEGLFGGKKHGWSLRYKKSKSFCTLIPEKNRFALLIVFGDTYDKAATYYDGKWLLLTIDSNKVVEDVLRLLAIKRKPKNN